MVVPMPESVSSSFCRAKTALLAARYPRVSASAELVHLALQHGGTDNVSVLLLEVKA